MRRRDIIMASPYAAELATQQVFAPVLDAINRPMQTMADVRRMAHTIEAIHEALDQHAPDSPDTLFRRSQRRERQSSDSAHAWKCRALDLNVQTTRPIALAGMTPINIDGWKLGIAVPSPSPVSLDMTEIDTLVILDPKSGEASIHQHKGPALIEPANTQRFTVHADAKAWARDFALARLEFVHASRQARRIANVPPAWNGLPPSALALGPVGKIDWPAADVITAGEGIDVKALNRALRRFPARVQSSYEFRSAA